jgi:hypothetical protein
MRYGFGGTILGTGRGASDDGVSSGNLTGCGGNNQFINNIMLPANMKTVATAGMK